MSLHIVMLEGAGGPVAILDVEGFPIISKWFIVYPKGKELSLVARTFLEFAIDHEPKIRKHMQTIWPSLKLALEGKKKTAPRKKRAAKKSLYTHYCLTKSSSRHVFKPDGICLEQI